MTGEPILPPLRNRIGGILPPLLNIPYRWYERDGEVQPALTLPRVFLSQAGNVQLTLSGHAGLHRIEIIQQLRCWLADGNRFGSGRV